MNRSAFAAVVSVALFTAGCPSESAPRAPVTLTDDQIPVPSSFAGEAEKAVTADNYKTKLEDMAKELGVEPATEVAPKRASPPPRPAADR